MSTITNMNVSPRLAQFLNRPNVGTIENAVTLWEAGQAPGVGLDAGGELLDAALLSGAMTPAEAAKKYKARLDAATGISEATRLHLMQKHYDRFIAQSYDAMLMAG